MDILTWLGPKVASKGPLATLVIIIVFHSFLHKNSPKFSWTPMPDKKMNDSGAIVMIQRSIVLPVDLKLQPLLALISPTCMKFFVHNYNAKT